MDSQEAKVYITLLIAASVTVIIVLYFIISMIRQHRVVTRLQKRSMEVELMALEQERKRIAADLHDELGPLLSSVRLQIGCIDVNAADEVIVQQSSEYIDTILKRLREISNGLMPQVLLRKGLLKALDEYTEAVNHSGVLRIEFAGHGEMHFSDEMKVHLFRIVQEITHNTMKHAAASLLEIKLLVSNDSIQLLFQDNGKGFDYAAVLKEGSGLGLTNIARRTEIMQGQFFLDSSASTGTRYQFEIPLTSTR